jgi:hypothetical protein
VAARFASFNCTPPEMNTYKTPAMRRFPDPGNPGHTLPENWYRQITGLPVPEDQLDIEQLQCQIIGGLSVELDRYYHGAVAIEVVAQWLMGQVQDERLVFAGRYLWNGIGLCKPHKQRERR